MARARTYLNNPILVDIVEHLVQNGRDDFLRTTSDSESDGGGIEITRESLCSEKGLSLEEIPFALVLNERNQSSDGTRLISTTNGFTNGEEMLTDHRWLPISTAGQSSP